MVKVEKENNKQRLDLFLSLNFPEYSRSSVRKLLDMGKISVNGEVEYRPNYKVREGDQIQLDSDEEFQRKHLPEFEMDLDIVYKDQDIVIVNKPSGIKVHPSSTTESDTLLNGLYYALKDEITEYGVNLVNRIDRGTSGLVVAAISPTGAWHYAQEFAETRVDKVYLAVVKRRWVERFGEESLKVGNFLNYDGQNRRQSVDKQTGDYALTYFQLVEDRGGDYVMIRCKPKTGRTHQIRVQLAHIHLPILGDTKYEGEPYQRLMLHSYQISLTDPNGEKLTANTDIPEEFIEAIT